jgi:hypothetical protein
MTTTQRKSTTSQVRNALGAVADSVSRTKNGTFVARRSFFYCSGRTSEQFTNDVSHALQAAGVAHTVTNSYEKRTAFRGGVSLAQQSHWGVEFELVA